MLQVIGMSHQPHHLEAPIVQAQQRADAHVIETCFLRPVERGKPVLVVCLLASNVVPLVSLWVVCLLEYLVGTYPRLFHGAKPLDVQRCRVDVYPSY